MSNLTLTITANITPNKGNIVYNYSPLKNLYKKIDDQDYTTLSEFNTKKLQFSLNHPVDIKPQFSYDGSVDLVLNDNNNIPRLINSRFKLTQNNTYEIPFHLNENPTNVYHEETFFLNTTLQKQYTSIPRFEFKQLLPDGDLSVGNYVFYVKYSDSDGNTTDIAAESSIISCFIGYDEQPRTISGGYREENSHKAIVLKLVNLDTQYNYIKLYYSKDTSDINQNKTTSIYEITDLYKYSGSSLTVRISGLETKTQITEEQLNLYNVVIRQAKTQAICQNRLFLGNIVEDIDDVQELTDIALRFCPYINSEESYDKIGSLNENYNRNGSTGSEYYSSNNIYYNVGYWNEEMYRFGIVFIYNSGRLSNVYNIRGIYEIPTAENTDNYISYSFYENSQRSYIPTDFKAGTVKSDENPYGVFRIAENDSSTNKIYSIGFYNKDFNDCKTVLEELNISGFFFVRQKRIPTILAQAVLLPESEVSDETYAVRVPMLPVEKTENNKTKYAVERFLTDRGTITNDYESRLYYSEKSSDVYAGICPEYNLNQPYYEQIFTGAKLPIRKISSGIFNNTNRHYYLNNTSSNNSNILTDDIKIIGMPDNTSARAINQKIFRGTAGSSVEAFRTSFINTKSDISFVKWNELDVDDNTVRNFTKGTTNLLRGIYGPHIIIDGLQNSLFNVGSVINIYIPDYDIDSNKSDYFQIRYDDNTPYYSVCDRYSIDNFEIDNNNILKLNDSEFIVYRGDCFICNYTARVNRNYQDSSDPINDIIVDELTWRKYFNNDPKHIDVLANINRSDINAVRLGSWVTVKVCCSRNISLRSEDKSYSSEKSLTGLYRTFYPISGFNSSGNSKIPESDVLNDGYGSTVGHLKFFRLNNQIYINKDFHNRIVYSDTNSDKEYTNSLRIFPMSNFRDYHIEFGSLTKLITVNSNLIGIFEHGIVQIPVSEKVQVAGTDISQVFLNSQEVLPESVNVISSEYGSQWKDSIIKTLDGKIYGVDTTAKKLWVTNGLQISIISDMVVGEFLNNNIPLSEHQFEEIIGIQNVKTHYNAFKDDVMFTFYVPNKINKNNEVVWNLCYNNTEKKFVTFYSWVPLESNNINNEFYSFDRKSTKKYLNDIGIKDYESYSSFVPTSTETTIELNNKIYKHGFGGIIDGIGKIRPCMWYDEQHPFEFEVIVNDKPASQKIFDNLRIISNNAEPESFHYEIIGDSYDFNEDKLTAYYRQEAKKQLFSNLGSDIIYDDTYTEIKPYHNIKSYDFPLYYMRVDRGDKIEDDYLVLVGNNGSYDYSELSGTELIHYEKLQELRMQEHAKAIDIAKQGRLRGNMQFLGDYWNVQINPIVFVEKNETWTNEVPPLTLYNGRLPNDLTKSEISVDRLPDGYNSLDQVELSSWGNRSEVKLKDKWIKVRIRYSGKQLALISLLQTMYQISYS